MELNVALSLFLLLFVVITALLNMVFNRRLLSSIAGGILLSLITLIIICPLSAVINSPHDYYAVIYALVVYFSFLFLFLYLLISIVCDGRRQEKHEGEKYK